MNRKCSILSTSKDKIESCLSKEQVVSLIKLYNDCSIDKHCYSNGNNKKISVSGTKNSLLKTLKGNLGVKDESMMRSFDFIKQDPLLYYNMKNVIYKKILPKRKNGWLNTSDINFTMNQYSKKYGFNYIGTLPSDYYKEPGSFNESLPCYIIFNTDPSYKPGEHWVAMIIDKNKNACFFDSNGDKPNRRISKFIKDNNFKLKWYNKESLQNKDGLCGAYAMYFLIKFARKQPLDLDKKKADTVVQKQEEEFYFKMK